MGAYLADVILLMYQFHNLKVTRKDNLKLMAVRFLVLVFNTGWLIYGNVLYYSKGTDQGCNNGYRLALFLVLLIGYFEMMKCCCLSLFLCILIPMFFFAVRRAQRPNWMPAAP